MFYFLENFARGIGAWLLKSDPVAHTLRFTVVFSAPRVNAVNVKVGDAHMMPLHMTSIIFL